MPSGSRPAPIIFGRSCITGGRTTIDGAEWRELDEFPFARAMEHDSPKLLVGRACEYLSSSRVVRPVWCSCSSMSLPRVTKARAETWARMAHLLDERRRAELDAPPAVDASLGRTPLTWLSIGPTTAGPGGGEGGGGGGQAGVIHAAGVIEPTDVDLVGVIGARVLDHPMPARQRRTNPRVVKRSGLRVRRRQCPRRIRGPRLEATIAINILAGIDPRHHNPRPNYTALRLALAHEPGSRQLTQSLGWFQRSAS
ncbi:DUF4158 domain-containing protein [Rhodococcus opacus]|nr:DUF4158 domain-containing protein [Rhodococcus opacus]